MKRTNFLTKLISFLLFGAMLAYLGVYVYRSFANDLRTAPAVYVELVDSLSITGIVVREERLISSSDAYVSVLAGSGSVLATGETIAVAYSSEAALERAGRIRELELQRQYILAALRGNSSDTEISKRENSIKSAITALGAARERHELDLLSEASVTLKSLVVTSPDVYTTEVDLNLVTDELNRLQAAASNDTKAISAPSSGLFFASADGFEYLSPEDLIGITPNKLRELFETEPESPGSVLGKLCDPLEWYYAAIIPFEYAERFQVDAVATLDFGRYCSAPVKASVVSIRYQADEECAVVFRCTSAATEILYARNASAEIVFGSTVGVRVPVEAVYEEEVEEKDEDTGEVKLVTRQYVYTVTGLQAEKKYINIIWESADYYLAEVSSSDPGGLREGNDIILTKRGIYDGMLLG